MRSESNWIGGLALFAAAVVASLGVAVAQIPGTQLTLEDADKLSTSQKLTRAAKDINQIKGVLELALQRLEAARAEKDIVKLNCVNDKLSAIKGLLKISEQADISLKEAAARKDGELINHEFTKISIAAIRAENFRVEVEGCVGELSQYTGGTVVERSVDPEIREDNPSEKEVEAFDPISSDRPDEQTATQ